MTMIDTAMGALRGVIGNRRAEGFKLLGSRETGTGRIASAGRGIAGTLHGIRRLSRAAVLALSCLLLLAGVVTQAPAQTPPTASFAWESQSAGEGSGTHDVRVWLLPAPTTDVTVAYTVGGTAASGSDFSIANSGTLSVPANTATATIPVTIVDDSDQEPSETVVLTLVASTAYSVADPGTHTLKIGDNDTPMAFFPKGGQTVREGSGTHNVKIALDRAPSSDITIKYAVAGAPFGIHRGAAEAGSDYAALPGTVAVPKGATTATIPVTIIDDDDSEWDEAFALSIAKGEGYRTGPSPLHIHKHILLIPANDSQAKVDFSGFWVDHGNYRSCCRNTTRVSEESRTHNIKVTLKPVPTTDITINYTVGGTATSGSDFTIPNSGALSVSAGANEAIIPVTVVDDSAGEFDETVVLTLAGGSGYRLGGRTWASVIITANDGTPSKKMSFAAKSHIAGEGTGTHDVEVTFDPVPSAGITVNYTVGGTATSGSDFSIANSGTLSVPANTATATIPVTIVDDNAIEDRAETVVLTLVGSAGYVPGEGNRYGSTHTLTIADNDTQWYSGGPVVRVTGGATVAEGEALPFTVTAEPAPENDLKVRLYVLDIIPRNTFLPPSGEGPKYMTIPAGQSSAIYRVQTRDDNVDRDRGYHSHPVVSVYVSDFKGMRYKPYPHPHSRAVGYVRDNNPTIASLVRTGPGAVLEGDGTVFTVTLSRSLFGFEHVDVPLSISGAGVTASDWSLTKKSGRFVTLLDAGTASPVVRFSNFRSRVATLELVATADSQSENIETITVSLGSDAAFDEAGRWTNVGGGADPHATQNSFDVQAFDSPSVTVSPVPPRLMAEGAVAGFTLAASPAPRAPLTVEVRLTGTDGDGTTETRQVTIPTSGAAQLDIVAGDDDAGGLITATVKTGDGYMVGDPASGTVMVGNNDSPEPAVTVAAGTSPVTEGGDAVFTLTATPAPAADLSVSVTVATDGDWGVSAGTRTVTIPTSGSATLTLATTDDAADEPDGSVTATVADGSGYTVGSAASGTVAVQDDDDPAAACTSRQAVAAYLVEVRDNPENKAVKGNPAHIAKWNRVLEAIGHDTGTGLSPMPASEIHANAAQWPDSPFKAASDHLNCVAAQQDPPQQQTPEIAISADAASVTEDGDAVFTLTASPAPAADLAVSVTVASDGDWGVTAGSRTVIIPASGSATLTLPTTGDATDEPDGSLTVTVTAGTGYTVGASASGTVSVQDDDAPLPEVTLAAGTSPVTEGGDAVFTLTATPAPAADLSVSVTVATDGDWGVTAGSRTVTVPATGSATLTLPTTGDDADEPDGSVTVTVAAGQGYTVGSSGSGTVSVRDDDDPAPPVAAVDPALVAEVRAMAAQTQHGAAHVKRWRRVLVAFGVEEHPGLTPTTLAEAKANAQKYSSPLWPKIVEALEKLEAAALAQQQQDPAITVTADAASVTEGGDAVYTLTASPAPAADLSVSVTVASDGDWGVTAGSRTVTIPATGSATLTLATTDDSADEPDGSLTVTVADGSGWTAGDPASGGVTVRDDDAPTLATPVVTLSAGSAVTEGGDAVFTLTATPAPAADLPVTVTVATDGDWGVTAGSRTVTIPTTGSATMALATADDSADEPDGSVTATVQAGSGYTVGASASGSVAVRDDDLPPPVVALSAGSAVTEGGDAVFTLTATPAPAADLPVTVTVATDGDWGVTPGSRTVTVPTSGSATLTLSTTDDATDEPDGSVTATVQAGSGYTVGASASGTVAVRDDDLPPPVVTVAANAASVTEGGDAVFTLTADRAPDSDVTVTLAVSETGDGDHVAAADEGPATLVIPKGATEAAFAVATVNDDVDEPDGTATVAVTACAGCTAGDPASASVTVKDDDLALTAPALSVGDSTAREGARLPVMPFTVRLSPAAPGPVRVHVSTRPSTPVSARPGQDYAPGSSDLTFRAGETEKVVWIRIYDDSHDEGAETFEVVLSKAEGAVIGDGVAVGTITNDDPMPAAFLARFGRTVAQQALDGIAARIAAPRVPGLEAALAGHALGSGHGDAMSGLTPSERRALAAERRAEEAMAELARAIVGEADPEDPFGDRMAGEPRAVDGTDALLGTAFTLTTARDGAGGTTAFWGRAARSGFDGAERGDGTDVLLDGTVTTAMLGADHARGRWLAGLALARSSATGGYRDGGGDGGGEVEATLSSVVPYAAFRASERLSLWAALGRGTGEVTLATAMEEDLSADADWSMAAAGLRGGLLGGHGSGPALAVVSDALRTRTSSEEVPGLAASESATSRLRLALEGSWTMALDGGGGLTPRLEIGLRRDGGDAETGLGIEAGGGVAWSDPARGFSLDVSGRTLVAHGNDDLEDWGVSASVSWDPFPETRRGPAISMRQAYGGSATGGLDALLSPDPLDPARAGGVEGARTAFEAAYGLPAFGGRFTGTPHAGCGVSGDARDCTVGWRLSPEARGAPDLSFGARATGREDGTGSAEGEFGIDLTVRW